SAPGTLHMSDLMLLSLPAVDANSAPTPVPVFRMGVPIRFRPTDEVALGVLEFDLMAEQLVGEVMRTSFYPAYDEVGRRFILENSVGNMLSDSLTRSMLSMFEIRDPLAPDEAIRRQRPENLNDLLAANTGNFNVIDQGNGVISAQTFVPEVNGVNFPWRLVIIDDSSVIFANNYNVSIFIFLLCI